MTLAHCIVQSKFYLKSKLEKLHCMSKRALLLRCMIPLLDDGAKFSFDAGRL